LFQQMDLTLWICAPPLPSAIPPTPLLIQPHGVMMIKRSLKTYGFFWHSQSLYSDVNTSQCHCWGIVISRDNSREALHGLNQNQEPASNWLTNGIAAHVSVSLIRGGRWRCMVGCQGGKGGFVPVNFVVNALMATTQPVLDPSAQLSHPWCSATYKTGLLQMFWPVLHINNFKLHQTKCQLSQPCHR
jgi:hypothetical protein